MDFKLWMHLQEYFERFFDEIKTSTLGSMRPTTDGGIAIKFPKPNPISYQRPQTATQHYQMALAAHRMHPNGFLANEVDYRRFPYGKGSKAFQSIQTRLMPNDAQDAELFQKTFGEKLEKIARPMGLLFELDVFLYLVENENLQEIGEKEFFYAASQRNTYLSEIKKYVGDMINHIAKFVQLHAEDLAKKIVVRSKSMLKCDPTHIEFTGGMSLSAKSTYKGTADIIIRCNQKDVGYSLKFSSEPRTVVANLSHTRIYKMLGGKSPKAFAKELQELEHDYKKIKDFLLNEFAKLAEERFSNSERSPELFAKLLESLISRGENVLPAFHDYISDKGWAGYSPNIQKDFNVVYRQGRKLSPKEDATVEVEYTSAYIKLIYRVPDGSRNGTRIFIYPRAEETTVKLNNMITQH